jgi:membrane protease YdiL (CAAX protease family)
MPETVQLGLVELGLMLASCAAWLWLIQRWWRGQSPLPQEEYKEVQWDFMDVLFVLCTYLAVMQITFSLLASPEQQWEELQEEVVVAQTKDTAEANHEPSAEQTSQHPVIQLLSQDATGKTLALVFLVTAIAAPLWEEFLFRLILLGWLAKREKQLKARSLGRLPLGLVPLLATSLIFALMHFRQDDAPIDSDTLLRGVTIMGITNFVCLGISIAYLRMRYQTTAADFGFSSQRLIYDIKVAVVGFLTVVVLVLLLQAALKTWLPSGFAPDPIPLFFLAMVFGLMYLRTGRLTSCVLLHMILNTFSLLAALAAVHFGVGQ